MKNSTKIFSLSIGLLLGLVPLFAFAAVATINLPGTQNYASPSDAVTGFIQNFYLFALLIAGILAFGAIVWGGIKYMTSGGNPSGESDGKAWVTAALLGILLLAGAYILLRTVNPDLLNLQLPTLPAVQTISAGNTIGSGGTGGSGSGGTVGTGCSGGSCQSLSADGINCKNSNSCSASQDMINTLQCMQQNGAPADTVTESMPPTSPHESHCHTDGCCVDVIVNSGSCADVQATVAAAKACGTTAANEYANCNGTTYTYTTGNNIHINANGCK